MMTPLGGTMFFLIVVTMYFNAVEPFHHCRFTSRVIEPFDPRCSRQMCHRQTSTVSIDGASASRDMQSLQEWAISRGVCLEAGVQLKAQGNGDWGLLLDQTSKAGNRILKIPSDLVLSSSRSAPSSCLEQDEVDFSICSLQKFGMEEYIPEFFLMMELLSERAKGPMSMWHFWFHSLPKEFSTGLYMDEVERLYVEVFASDFLKHQEMQWEAFYSTSRELCRRTDSLASTFLSGMDDSVLKWAFSVIFTRSWRTKDKVPCATIVPIGDMFNHNSGFSNVWVDQASSDSDVDIRASRDMEPGADLYLSYGITQYPARFLVIFGFCDESCPAIFANVTVPPSTVETGNELNDDAGFMDHTKMVFFTANGAISDTVWNAVLYKILLEHDQSDVAQTFYKACKNNDWDIVVDMHTKWGVEVTRFLQSHVEGMLIRTYAPLPPFTREDYVEHPRLELIVRYNTFMISVLIKVKKHLEEAMDKARARQAQI
eukprot:scaffold25867_cov55-Attheya_sp.AAC.2